MKIGIMTGARPTNDNVNEIGRTHTIDEVVGLAQRAENAGIDTLWMANVFSLDAIMMMALAGQATSKIELGTAVTPTYPRHPTAIAQQAVTAAAAADNRFTLGIGLAHKVMVEDALGISFAKPAHHMKEYLAILEPLLAGDTVNFEGQQYTTRNISVGAAGANAVPLVVAALGDHMLRLAGHHSSGTITWMVGPQTLNSHIIPKITKAAEEVSKPTPRIIAGAPIVVTNDPDGAKAKINLGLALYAQLPSYRAMMDKEGAQHPADLSIVGDEKVVREGLARLRDAGATDFNAAIAEVDAGAFDRTFELLASEAN